MVQEEGEMGDIFAKLLQNYMFHRDCEARWHGDQAYKWPDDRGGLEDAWKESVEVALVKYSQHSDIAVSYEEAIGCVKIVIKGKVFWVPAPLMAFIPTPEDMEKLHDAAQEAKLFSASRICLSGSTVLTGAIKSVGDLDLFEYVSEQALTRELLNSTPQYRLDKFHCTEISVAEIDGKFPKSVDRTSLTENDIDPKKMRTFAAKYLVKFNFAKIDMIGMFNGQVGEVTNIAYKHKDSMEFNYDTPFPSFSFQEVLTGKEPPAKGAYSLKNFGEYVFWLRDEIESILRVVESEWDKNGKLKRESMHKAVKLAKRSMSLSGMIGENSLVSDFLIALESKESKSYCFESAAKILGPLLVVDIDGGDDIIANKCMKWIEDQKRMLKEEKPESLDVQNLIELSSDLITRFHCLCYPNFCSEVKDDG